MRVRETRHGASKSQTTRGEASGGRASKDVNADVTQGTSALPQAIAHEHVTCFFRAIETSSLPLGNRALRIASYNRSALKSPWFLRI